MFGFLLAFATSLRAIHLDFEPLLEAIKFFFCSNIDQTSRATKNAFSFISPYPVLSKSPFHLP